MTLDVVARDFAAWRRRLGKAKRAQHRGGSLGTLRFAQPTSLTLDPHADQYVSRIFGAKNYLVLDHVL